MVDGKRFELFFVIRYSLYAKAQLTIRSPLTSDFRPLTSDFWLLPALFPHAPCPMPFQIRNPKFEIRNSAICPLSSVIWFLTSDL